jgi:hypothetical protein
VISGSVDYPIWAIGWPVLEYFDSPGHSLGFRALAGILFPGYRILIGQPLTHAALEYSNVCNTVFLQFGRSQRCCLAGLAHQQDFGFLQFQYLGIRSEILDMAILRALTIWPFVVIWPLQKHPQ